MKPTTKWITGTLVVAGIIYALSPGPSHLIANPDAWELREQFVFLTGIATLSLMVLSMIISLRIPWINHRMKGLDKAYVVHKWTGIFAALLMLFHWLTEKMPHLLVETGFIAGPGELTDGSSFSDLEVGLFQSGVALVEYTFYLIIILIVIALSRKIPYHIFRKTHKIFPMLFLIAAYHGATAQLKEHWLSTPAGYLLLVLVSIGIPAPFISLFQRIGASRKTTAIINKVDLGKDGIIVLQLSTSPKVFPHKAGQFAFLRFVGESEAHPFTIASWTENSVNPGFAIKPLGNFTGKLATKLGTGQEVGIEGPYGEFIFNSSSKRQIWIAGGIGITPFLARLQYLSSIGEPKTPVDFWYCTRNDLQDSYPESLEDLCRHADVNLFHLNSSKKEYLTAKMLHETAGSFQDVSIWFCGPSAFAHCLLKGLSVYDFDKRHFHYENFSMR